MHQFPSKAHDGITDSVTRALNFLREQREHGMFAYYREEYERVRQGKLTDAEIQAGIEARKAKWTI